MSALLKWYMKVLMAVRAQIRRGQVRWAIQLAYEQGKSTSSVVGLLREAVFLASFWKKRIVICSLDIRKFFERIPHAKICESLERLGTPAWLTYAIMRELSLTKGRARIHDTGYSEPFPIERGAKVGATEAPDLSKDVIEYAFGEAARKWAEEGVGFRLPACGKEADEEEEAGDDIVCSHIWWADNLFLLASEVEDMRRILHDISECLRTMDLEWKADSLQVLWGEHWKEEDKVALHVTQKNGGKLVFVEVEELQVQ